MQIKYVNRALYRFDSTQVIPVQFVIFTLSVIIGSAILYRDFERKSAEDGIKFAGGCALTFLGVWCITSGRSKGGDSDEESGSESDDQISLIDEEGQLPEIREDDEESPLRPMTPRMKSSQSDAPMFKFTQYDSNEPSPMNEDPIQRLYHPATAAAIHDDRAELPVTPSPKRPTRNSKPPMHATTSEPTLPTTANPYRPSTAPNTPLRDRRSQDHLRASDQEALEPATASVPRYGSLTRSSIASMIAPPGPLTNPLSNSLSVIVADSLRRGVDAPPHRRTLRSKRSRRLERHSSNIEGGNISRPAETERPTGRGRSLSSTIGDLLRSKRGQRRSTGGEEREGDAV